MSESQRIRNADVLVTGGTGFFGRSFVRRCLDLGARRVCVFSRDEAKQARMRQDFGDDPRLRWFIGDVRDLARLTRAMAGINIVVHAAALKRIEVGAYNPDEMVKTNVGGAMNVIEAAYVAGVKQVVALSTDKAFAPVSPYGQSKALAEGLFIAANHQYGSHGPMFSVVRYGNVSGSTGSVIPKWRQMIEAGERIKVTDPECTRFWMTADQAVDLVVQTIDIQQGAELSIPELPAYRLGDLAAAMGITDYDVIGLPAWEKKHESMDEWRCSATADRMTVEQIKEGLLYV